MWHCYLGAWQCHTNHNFLIQRYLYLIPLNLQHQLGQITTRWTYLHKAWLAISWMHLLLFQKKQPLSEMLSHLKLISLQKQLLYQPLLNQKQQVFLIVRYVTGFWRQLCLFFLFFLYATDFPSIGSRSYEFLSLKNLISLMFSNWNPILSTNLMQK